MTVWRQSKTRVGKVYMIFGKSKLGRYHSPESLVDMNYIRTDFIIRLPMDKTGQLDWAYMEEYMRKVERKTEGMLNQFVSAKKDCENER